MIVIFEKGYNPRALREDLEIYTRAFEGQNLNFNECHKCGGKMSLLFVPLQQKDIFAYKSYLSCPSCHSRYLLE